MKRKSVKYIIIGVIVGLISSLFILSNMKGDNKLEQYGLLSINYDEFKDYKPNFNMDIGDYNYDIENRFDNSEDMQSAFNEISKINYIYQDILFMHSILTKKETSYILNEDKESFLNMINEGTLKQWNQMLVDEEKTINKELLLEEEIYLLDNLSTLRELVKQSMEKSLNKEYDIETLTLISKNIEENMGYLITINLISEGHKKKEIDEVLNGLNNNKDTFFKDSFYYKYMFE